MTATAPVHDRLATLADPTRGRILLALESQELTVGELCQVLGLPQSTVSRHLRVLADDVWLTTRQEGTSRYYARNASLDAGAERLWAVVSDDLRSGDEVARDRARLAQVVAQRRARSRAFFASAGASWDEVREELFGNAVGGGALLGLLDPSWTVGDLGCGAGHLSALLAPFVARVVAVDESDAMLERARVRAAGAPNVEFRRGVLEALPLPDGALDAAILSLVLHHAPTPGRVLREARRVLKPGGRLLVVDLQPHEQADFRERLGHVWLGFAPGQVADWLSAAGFSATRVVPIAPQGKGPGLFVAAGTALPAVGPATAAPGVTGASSSRS